MSQTNSLKLNIHRSDSILAQFGSTFIVSVELYWFSVKRRLSKNANALMSTFVDAKL